jgi:hypothetical protein
MEHANLKEGQHTYIDGAVSHTAMLAFNNGQALVDPATLNMREEFSKMIVNRMVDAVLKKREEEVTYITLLSKRCYAVPWPGNVSPTARLYTPVHGCLDMDTI